MQGIIKIIETIHEEIILLAKELQSLAITDLSKASTKIKTTGHKIEELTAQLKYLQAIQAAEDTICNIGSIIDEIEKTLTEELQSDNATQESVMKQLTQLAEATHAASDVAFAMDLTRPILSHAKLNEEHMKAVDKAIGLIKAYENGLRRRALRLTLSVALNFSHLLSKEIPMSKSVQAGLALGFPVEDLQDKADSDEMKALFKLWNELDIKNTLALNTLSVDQKITAVLTTLVATIPVPSASWQDAASPEKKAIQGIINKINSKPDIYSNSTSIEKTKNFFHEPLKILKNDEKNNINLICVCERLVSYLDESLVRNATEHPNANDRRLANVL